MMLEEPDPKRNINSYRPPALVGKPVDIDLLYIHAIDRYQVTNITNTAWYKPGDLLTTEIVGKICEIDQWTIRIGSYQLMKKIWDLVAPKISLL